MCGRYTLAADPDELVEAFRVPELSFPYVRRYNVAPGQEAPVVAEDRRGRRMGLLTWGLVPSWRDEPGSGLINARAESVAAKASFREAFARRRCLVPTDGFYEWARSGGGKIPHWLHPARGGLLSFAGVWERWERVGHEPRHTFAILTTDANDDVKAIHERMPVVIAAEDRDLWLDRASDRQALLGLLRPPPGGTLVARRVSTRVNRPEEDDPELLEPVQS